MLYCPHCRRLFEGEKCPECGKKNGREPQGEDLCVLFSNGQIWTDMACDILKQNDIPCMVQGYMGAGMAMLTGMQLETYTVFVSFTDFPRAKEIIDGVFAQTEDGDSEQEYEAFDGEPEQEEEEKN